MQDRNRRSVAAIRQRREKVVRKTLVAMRPRAGSVTDLGKEIAEAAMRMDVIGIHGECGFEVDAGLRMIAEQQQEIAQIDVPVGIARMMPHRLAEQRARGFTIAGIENQRAEIVQSAEISRVAPN